MGKLFQFRFDEGSELKGHSFGNLFIAAMSQVTGDFDAAIKESSKVLAIRGRVLPSTLDKACLVARHVNGTQTVGESNIPKADSRIASVSLRPSDCKATEEAIDAIRKADAIVLGPGSLYTSIMPNLLVGSIAREIAGSKAIKIYVCNVMTQKGETDGFKASDHLRAIISHAGSGVVEYCVVNTAKIPQEMLARYKAEEAYPVAADTENIRKLKVKAVEAHIISTRDYVRHDAPRLAKIIMDLASSLKKMKG
jgi:uncharacterized cofD-like protein